MPRTKQAVEHSGSIAHASPYGIGRRVPHRFQEHLRGLALADGEPKGRLPDLDLDRHAAGSREGEEQSGVQQDGLHANPLSGELAGTAKRCTRAILETQLTL